MKKLLVAFTCLLHITLHAQLSQPIVIETKNAAIVLTAGNNMRVTQAYFGKKLSPPEYAQL
ncbi:MAG TPA: hypothetical protein VHM26_03465, partial [Chitinophagaceae bacterium]|nr:hypothetical protein [Chitinophagaceae bacterium]